MNLVSGSFRRQIILTFVVGFFFLIAAFSAYQVRRESSYLYRDSSAETTSMAESLAASSRSWVLANDVAGLQEVVHSFQGHRGLRYAMVLSRDGRVLGHSDPEIVGQYVSDRVSLSLIDGPPVSRVLADDEATVDIAVPVMTENHHVGWARVGLGRDAIADNLRKMKLASALFVLLSVALSLIAALLIANRLGYRIRILMRVAEEVQAGDYGSRVELTGRDEIARLAASLNHMLDVLARDEEQLRTASRYTRSLIEASLDPLVTISPEGKITDVNRATEQATGMSRSELVGTDFSEYFTEPDRAREGYRQVFANGFVTDYPLVLRNRDGHLADVLYNASVYRDEAGDVQGVFAAARDITDRRRAEIELRELNKDFITLLENSGDFIYFKDKDSRIRFCSQTLAKITGHTSWREMIGKHDSEIFPADTARIYREEELPIFGEGRALLNKTDPYYDDSGRQGWVSTNKWPVFGDDKKTVVGIFGISRDITELKLAEDKINELNRDLERRVEERTEQLEAANKELEAFSYSVSHDLRTPLRAIDGFSRILLDDYNDRLDDEGRRLLGVVRDNTSRMGQLIDDILKFSRTGRVELNFSQTDMSRLVREVFDELSIAGAESKPSLDVGVLPNAFCDSAMMRQVFVNLLSNAIKFSRSKPEPKISVGGRVEGGEAIYYVKDNGVGFDMQYADKLFGVFQRLHGVTEFEGTGIGLAIVKRVITRHGGRVWADGKMGEGATIYFALPTGEKDHG